jgi:hypothetical protein
MYFVKRNSFLKKKHTVCRTSANCHGTPHTYSQLPTHSTNKTRPIFKCQPKVTCITVFPDLTPLTSLDKYQHISGNMTLPPSQNLPTIKMKATGSSKIPVSIYWHTCSHFPLDPNLDTHNTHNLKSHTRNLHFFHTRCSVYTTTIQPNWFCRTFCPSQLLSLILTVHCTASADPLTVHKPPPCWDPTAYATNRLYSIMRSHFVSDSENSQMTATQISQNMQQPHSTVQNTKNCVIIEHRNRDIKHTVKIKSQALMLVAIQERDLVQKQVMVTSQ